MVAGILLGIDDAAVGRALAATLAEAGHTVTWVGALEVTPAPTQPSPDLIIIDGDARGMDLAVVSAAWRRREAPPAVLVLGAGGPARLAAERVRARVLPKPIDPDALVSEIGRLTVPATDALSARAALKMLGLPGGGLVEDEAAAIVQAARNAEIGRIHEALRPHLDGYIAATGLAAALVERRVLARAEARVVRHLDGSRTIRGVIAQIAQPSESTPEALHPLLAVRLMWALLSTGAIALVPAPPPRHPTTVLRAHIRARATRLAGATHYEVLELGVEATAPEIEHATVLLESRYGPGARANHDLGDLTGTADRLWEQIVQARRVLGDPRLRAVYDTTVGPRARELEEARQLRRTLIEEGERFFTRGQNAIRRGAIFRAVSHLATAARRMPDRPDYEICAAWARLLAEDLRAGDRFDRVGAARRERATAEELLRGRRPWPRALFVLGLLCETAGDLPAAIEYLREAAECDPELQAARQALARLGAQ